MQRPIVFLAGLFLMLAWVPGPFLRAQGFDPNSILRPAEQSVQVIVHAWPPHAGLYLETRNGPIAVGTTDEQTHVMLPVRDTSARLTVRADGYEARTFQVFLPPDGSRTIVFPPTGTLRLTATNPFVDVVTWLRLYPVPAVLVLALLVGIGRFLVYPRVRRLRLKMNRARNLEALVADDEVRDTLTGRQLGKYRVCGRIAEGGMAVVYRAVPNDTLAAEESVAIKVMKPELFSDDEVRERFRREVLILRELNHPLVARIIDWGEQKKLLYMVTELVRGETLRERIPADGMSVPAAMAMLEPIFQAVTYIHSKDVVHRNLKPENIMLLPKDKIKIIDFGLARGVGSSRLTAAGVVLGTPAYMAPEQVKGEATDHRSDQYALGILVFEMVTGQKPFKANNRMTLMHMQVSDQAPRMRDVKPNVPEDVDSVVQRMLAKSADQRYPSVEAAWKDLQQVAARV